MRNQRYLEVEVGSVLIAPEIPKVYFESGLGWLLFFLEQYSVPGETDPRNPGHQPAVVFAC